MTKTDKERGISDTAGYLADGNRVTWVGAAVNVLLIGVKAVAGILGGSQALIADAVHSASDLFTDAIVLFGLRMGRKPPDDEHHFGHARIETLASLVVGLALIATAVYIGLEAGGNIYRHTASHPTGLAVLGAALSIAIKEALYRYTVLVGRRIGSPLIVANAWHHRSDALSSVAVLLGVAAAYIHPAWDMLDAYAALLVSFFIVKVGLDILGNAVREVTDTAPPPETMAVMIRCARSVAGVINAHDLRVRISGGRYQVEIHIVVDGGLSVIEGHRIAKKVERCLAEKVTSLDRAIVHVDPLEEHKKSDHS